MPMIVIKDRGITLSGAAIVDNYELPATPLHWCTTDLVDD
jgi:hypothetical protein